jgi:hypothetical protein
MEKPDKATCVREVSVKQVGYGMVMNLLDIWWVYGGLTCTGSSWLSVHQTIQIQNEIKLIWVAVP